MTTVSSSPTPLSLHPSTSPLLIPSPFPTPRSLPLSIAQPGSSPPPPPTLSGSSHPGHHLLRLHFHPFSTPSFNLSSALFHVSTSNLVLLSNFNPADLPGPILREFIIRSPSDELILSFTPASQSTFAFVNAIEVFSAPADLVPDIARLVSPDHVQFYDLVSSQALETLYRINVGGLKVTPFNDTLWRTWIPDSKFLTSDSRTKVVTFSGRINYREHRASREVVPDNVDNTARVLEIKLNMTWAFDVSAGYQYFIRMHFCDIASLALNELYFNIYINGYSAYEYFDLSDATSQFLASPFYMDFVTDVVNSSGVLTVSIGASNFSSPSWVQGMLNGLEIMKMNNTVGSFDGEFPVSAILVKPVKGFFGEFARWFVCGIGFISLFSIVFMLVLRLRAEAWNALAWSRLPTEVSEGKPAKGNLMLTTEI
ncbi:probable receptor-like protein kinase At5g24010 [Dioscorea cayenensis subsp. rotundata]|uniref:Probable receptor-like protein kinase At5g24010 n=1 Tax=Dioscorea cayennensis subsp. rotundata TaxID=55577 RepID=A0AB40CG32_DIOCR|nr:probable receptor-like protein kinase At5g24010 [Dioscorea cayenensis subsp. rotundata]